MATGSSIIKELADLPLEKRQPRIAQLLLEGQHPSWVTAMRPIVVEKTIDGKNYRLEYFVSPDYVALGDDEDYFRVPLIPSVAQGFADNHEAMLPTTQIVDSIYFDKGATHLIPKPLVNKGKIREWADHDIAIQQQFKALGLKPGMLVAGHKKDIVVPSVLGRVAIYGWHDESGANTKGVPNAPIQSYTTVHDDQFADYSHGTRLVYRVANLNGSPVDLATLCSDPKLYSLVSKSPCVPRYAFKKTGSSLVDDAPPVTIEVAKREDSSSKASTYLAYGVLAVSVGAITWGAVSLLRGNQQR